MKLAAIEPFFAALKAANPNPVTELEYTSVFELLAAVLLSAQATDVSVNKATRRLFAIAPTPQAMHDLGVQGIESYIRTIGLFRTKARNLHETCRILLAEHAGLVPRSREALERLPGVGRKTANVILGNAFEINEGIVVDTHVQRLARRLGLTRQADPIGIERALMPLFPQDDWALLSHLLIWHGRRVCSARKPACGDCVIAAVCPSAGRPS